MGTKILINGFSYMLARHSLSLIFGVIKYYFAREMLLFTISLVLIHRAASNL